MTLGQVIRERRVALGMHGKVVAALIGCSKTYYSIIEHDGRAPSRPLLERLAVVFQLDLDELLVLARRATPCPHCGGLVPNVRWSKHHDQGFAR